MSTTENYIEQEVRIRLLEKISSDTEKRFKLVDERFDKVDERFNKVESKIDSNFHWTIGMLFTILLAMIGLFGGLIFTQIHS